MIPSPTEYCLLMAVRPIICLDLNGTLLHRTRKQSFKPRPHLQSFLDFTFEHFDVVVWTSGTKKNMQPIVKKLFKGRNLVAELYRPTCTLTPTTGEPWKTKKDVSLLRSQYFSNAQNRFVIVVDDTFDKIITDERSRYLYIPKFTGQGDDDKLRDLELDLICILLDVYI